jgi:hypothetical protein
MAVFSNEDITMINALKLFSVLHLSAIEIIFSMTFARCLGFASSSIRDTKKELT